MIDVSNDICDIHNASYLKYLTFIQDVITRMNRNAFQLKGWCITIVAAVSALAVNNGNMKLLLVAAVLTVPFCFLDAYYLLMERWFRGLYNDVVAGDKSIKLFTMPINRYFYKAQTNEETKKKYNYWRVICSGAVLGFYLPLASICLMTWAWGNVVSIETGDRHKINRINVMESNKCVLPNCDELRLNNKGDSSIGEESFHWEHKWR